MIYITHNKSVIDHTPELIEWFKSNLLRSYIWSETRVLCMDKFGIGRDDLPDTYYKFANLCKEIKSNVSGDDRFNVLQNVEIVKYPAGACKGWHYDRTRPTTTGASITYLNDDYIGGHTIVEGIDVQPIAGRTIFFDGLEYRHAVSNVLKNDRYTISMWYGSDPTLPLNQEFLEI